MIASRSVTLRPGKQCICYLSCHCSCGNESLSCHLITELDALKAGIYKSRAARSSTERRPYNGVKQFLICCLGVKLAAGFLKACLGCLGCERVGQCGLHSLIYGKGHLKHYYEPEIRKYTVQHDREGHPIHPKTKLRMRVISYKTEFLLNVFFFIIWPVLMCRKSVDRGSPSTYQYHVLDSSSTSLDDQSDRITRPTSEFIEPTKLICERRTRSHT
ncbi:hapless 2-like [Dermacentor variabilis]|uniref:hapless 2-like n=1 Tax=Dermacentor variabilis TaxID=34621 RepID=UPI003F5B3EC7